jgi:hypothetical protein
MAFEFTSSGVLEQRNHVVFEVSVQELVWRMSSQFGVFRDGCRDLGG